jgi:hypothetical protein
MIVTTLKTKYRDVTYYKIFVKNEYIGYGFDEQESIDFGIKYAKKEGLK